MPASANARDSQRARVLGAIALASLPFLLLTALFVWRARADAEARVAEERLALAESSALTAAAFVEGNLATIRSLARVPSLTDPSDPARLRALLDQIVAENPEWEGAGLSDEDGWNIASTGAEPRTLNVGDRSYFQYVLATGRPTVSSAVLNRRTGNPTIIVAAPVQLQTGGRGVILASLSTARLGAELVRLREEAGLRLIVVDSEGQAFVHPDPAVARSLANLRGQPTFDAVLSGQRGVFQGVGVDGADALIAYAPVPNAGWGVVVSQPASVAFGLVRREVGVTVGLLGLAVSSACAIGWWLGGRLSLFYRRQIDARAQAEATARELRAVTAESDARRRFLERLIETAPVAIAVFRGPEHRCEMINSRYQAMRPNTAMIDRTAREVFPELENQWMIDLLDQVFRTGEQVSGIDQVFQIADGSGQLRDRYFTFVVARYEDAEGQPEGVLAVSLEMTEAVQARHRAEHEKDEFLSIASHELKTPLTSLTLAAQMIGRMLERGPLDPARLQRLVGTIGDQSGRAARLIGDLLDLSRLDAGGGDRGRQPLDLIPLVRAAVQRQRDALPDDSAHQLVEAYEPSSAFIVGDDSRLDQVLTNLLTNAVKYSPHGGQIEVRLSVEDGQVRLRVADRGIGIPEAERDRLFTPFTRTSAARESGVEGTGLGLYISRRIVEAHSGTIRLEDSAAGGTTFVVTLPVSEPGPS